MIFALIPFLLLHFAKCGVVKRESTMDRVNRVLDQYPVIDGHNDFPMAIRDLVRNNISNVPFEKDLTQEEPWASFYANHVDLPRMRKGKMGGQFWSAYVSCESQFKNSIQLFMEQVDIIKQFVKRYPNDLMWATSTADIESAAEQGKIASMIGMESGHGIGSSLPILRTFYDMGVRYMTLTHGCNTPWADAAQVESGDFPPRANGITEFGVKVVHEMNRLGMLVDLSHVSSDVMRQVLDVTKAPIIFSHSGARAICSHPRNAPDDVLEKVAENGGVVMVNFFTCFLADDCRDRDVTVQDAVAHINHIRQVAGVDHVGIGGDYDGVPWTPIGLEDTSQYPNLFAALIEDDTFEWTDEDLGKLASGNILRTFKEVEFVRDALALGGVEADNSWIPEEDIQEDLQCSYDFPPAGPQHS